MVSSRVVLLGLVSLLSVVLTAGVSAAAPPGVATPVAPAGVVGGSTLAFAWGAAPGATFYYLQVNDAGASPRFTQWFPAGQACAGGSATCVVTLSAGFAAGAAIWWVQTWNPDGFGPWSTGMRLTINYVQGAWSHSLAPADRFQFVLGGSGVLDRETGLVWQRTPSSSTQIWAAAFEACLNQATGGRRGWRLPTMEELASLADPTQFGPALPPGHPFVGVGTTDLYWSATTYPGDTTFAFLLGLATGGAGKFGKGLSLRAWCVRSGHGAEGL